MLSEKRITYTAKTVVDDVEIANYGAIIDIVTNDLSMYTLDIPAITRPSSPLRASFAFVTIMPSETES